MGRRNEHSQTEIKTMALAAAKDIVVQQSFQNLSARKVAKMIGYTVGTLYVVFKNFDDLILHLNAQTLDAISEKMTSVTTQPYASFEERMLALGKAYIEFAQDNPNCWNMLFEHRLPLGEPLPTWYQKKLTTLFNLLEHQLVKHGAFSPEKAALAGSVLWSGVHGICTLSLNEKLDVSGNDSSEALLNSLVTCYLSGFQESCVSP